MVYLKEIIMGIEIFHQCGHNAIWNKKSLEEDGCGSGLIFSPTNQKRSIIEGFSPAIKELSFFDPQYYLPNSQKANLKTYDFFPETISGSFATANFSMHALESAKRCVEFQLEQKFCRIVVPTRHFQDMVTDYTEKQDIYTVQPFLETLNSSGTDKEVFLSLSLTSSMLKDDKYVTDILNWVTSYPRIDGVYLIMEHSRTTKQIYDRELLFKYLKLVKELTDVDLKVLVAYTNTEGLLFSLIDGCEITFGAYENTRIFSLDRFVVSDDDRRGPKARIYLPGLFNWVLYSQAKQIQSRLPDIWENVYLPTDYADKALKLTTEPHFNTPELYRHYFLAYQSQVLELSELDIVGRHNYLRERLLNAIDFNNEILDAPIDLDKHGSGGHIQMWLDAINWFYGEFIA